MSSASSLGRSHVSRSTVERLREERDSVRKAYDTLAKTLRFQREVAIAAVLAALAGGFALGLAARGVALWMGWWS